MGNFCSNQIMLQGVGNYLQKQDCQKKRTHILVYGRYYLFTSSYPNFITSLMVFIAVSRSYCFSPSGSSE